MVKAIMSTGLAVVVADDVTSLLQLSAGVRMSQGQRILAAVAKGGDTICVQAAAGDVAPVTGSFTARASEQAVIAAAGSVAAEAGSFCVSKQDVLLLQRTLGLNTAGDFEAALGSKNKPKPTTTTTTAVWLAADHNYAGSVGKNVTVQVDGCPNVEAGLVQTVDASVSDKKQKKADKKKLDADQLRVCGCRNFLKDSVNMPKFFERAEDALKKALEEGGGTLLLQQRNFDAALASKKAKKATTTTTTTTIDLTDTNLARACTAGREFFVDWTEVAKQLNNREHADLYKSLNITGGWQQCDKSWVVHGACREYMPAATRTEARRSLPAGMSAEIAAAAAKRAEKKAAEKKAAEKKAAEKKAAEKKAAEKKADEKKADENGGDADTGDAGAGDETSNNGAGAGDAGTGENSDEGGGDAGTGDDAGDDTDKGQQDTGK